MNFLKLILTLFVLSSCKGVGKSSLADQEKYQGPTSMMDSATILVSKNGDISSRLIATLQNIYPNGDTEWSKCFYMETFDSLGHVAVTFQAENVNYSKSKQQYHATVDVFVQNIKTKDHLKTQELYWDISKKKIYTHTFVTIHADGETHTGDGLEANQDFTVYKIINPSGTFQLEEASANNP